MAVKKTCTLPTVRCDEATKHRVKRAAQALDITVTVFIDQAIAEKLARMEADWRSLNAVFSPVDPDKAA